jgi:hypothetical protein
MMLKLQEGVKPSFFMSGVGFFFMSGVGFALS